MSTTSPARQPQPETEAGRRFMESLEWSGPTDEQAAAAIGAIESEARRAGWEQVRNILHEYGFDGWGVMYRQIEAALSPQEPPAQGEPQR